MVRIAWSGRVHQEAALVRMVAPAWIPGPIHYSRCRSKRQHWLRSRQRCGLCVPIENSIDGSMLPTLDSLAIGVRLQVFAEEQRDV